MKFIIDENSSVFGEKRFPLLFKKVQSLEIGEYGDFIYPFYHKCLVAVWYDDKNDRFRNEIIGEFKCLKKQRKHFWKKDFDVRLYGFYSVYEECDINWLVKFVEKQIINLTN